ncbi:23S rRNA (cytidine(2498)-2'-O)-methyltransferase RlmM [Methylothermus subterraneus]
MRADPEKIQLPLGGGFIALSRPGFERELAQELLDFDLGPVAAEAGSGYAVLTVQRPLPLAWEKVPIWNGLIFARQVWPWTRRLERLPAGDRLTPILAELAGPTWRRRYARIVLEFPDSEAGRPLARLCRSFAKPLTQALQTRGYLTAAAPWELRLLFTASTTVWLGEAPAGLACPWPGGILRLKFPKHAPSRSVLKLVEAVQVLLSEEERARLLRPGRRAVDLGAAPGGWSWQLASWGLAVTAVDHARLAKEALATGLVEHVSADGFKWRPTRPVTWMFCDMIERPQQVTELVVQWLTRGWCQHALFNLKLPMQNRLPTLRAAILRLRRAGLEVRVKHLYHDREEVTAYVRRLNG